MKISPTGSSLKQLAYAKRTWGAQGKDKKSIALDVGYSRFSANSVKSKIENKRGYNNAVAKLAADSNNVALQVLHEFKARGLEGFSNKDLVGALNAIGSAWSRFNAQSKGTNDNEKTSKNKLRTVILQRVENQTVQSGTEVKQLQTPEDIKEVEDMVNEVEAEDLDPGEDGGEEDKKG